MVLKETIKEIIRETVNETIKKMKMAGLTNDSGKPAMAKLEDLLYGYPVFKSVKGKKKTEKMADQVEKALANIKKDQYYDIIELYYFERFSLESIAEYLKVSTMTVSRNKQRLLKKMLPQIFSEEMIEELFL